MDGFTRPPAGGGAQIPPTVPLEQAGDDRKEKYAGLAKLREEELKELEGKLPGVEEPEPKFKFDLEIPPAAEEKPDPLTLPTDEDKQAFVRALLASKSFEKKYTLFGKLDACFVDRTTEQSEVLFQQIEIDSANAVIKTDNDGQWQVWVERYQLASTLRDLRQTGTGTQSFPPTDKLHERVKELMKMPKPIYQGLMQTSRYFETLVSSMTERAIDADFWKAAGGGLPSKRT
jgi:hypothetical protein